MKKAHRPNTSEETKEMTTAEKLKSLVRISKRLTKSEQRILGLQMYDQMGLDIDDIETMASSVGLEVDDLLLGRPATNFLMRPNTGPGREATTHDIADFAAMRRHRPKETQMSWQQIFLEWEQMFPDDERVESKEDIREAYRRRYGDKAGK